MMSEFEYEIALKEADEKDADLKMKALLILAKKLKAEVLVGLSNMVLNDPAKTKLAISYLGI